MRICRTCNIEKEEIKFDGNRNHCKKCNNQKYYKKAKEGLYNIDIQKICKSCNIEKSSNDFRIHRNKCKKCENKELYESRKDVQSINNKEYLSKYRLENKDKINSKYRLYKKKRLKNDILFKCALRISGIINNSLRYTGISKKYKSREILGVSSEEFKTYLESKFEDWMNWENYGKYNGELNYGWDIDHIIPISSAETEDDIYKLNHYTNLQPLCSYTNRYIKKNNLV
jgi:hypothetical protein